MGLFLSNNFWAYSPPSEMCKTIMKHIISGESKSVAKLYLVRPSFLETE